MSSKIEKLKVATAKYNKARQMLGRANRVKASPTVKGDIFRAMNKLRNFILDLMLAIRIDTLRNEQQVLDQTTRNYTAFNDFADFLNATGEHYRPSMDMRIPEVKWLADKFDEASAKLGKSVRAWRYGRWV